MKRDDLVVAVLAGGEGTRIGGAKPLRTLGGERLIDRAVRRARAWSPDIVVAVRTEAQVGPLAAETIRDAPGIAGPLAGLAAALDRAQAAGRAAVLTLPCDAPFVPDDLIEKLEAAIGNRLAAVAASGGEIHPTCALWKVEARDRLAAYLATGRRSLRGFADQLGYAEVEWAAEPFDPFFNVNSAADLRRAEEILARI